MPTINTLSAWMGRTFALWVLAFTGLALLAPSAFTWIGPWIPLMLGVIMFGMGMTLSLGDFRKVLAQPRAVAIGVAAQFIIMPGLAWALATGLRLPPEVAVGVILVGACPGGTASNVITFLARGDTALSVALTSVTTLLAPLVTPALIYLLASQWLEVSAWAMFISVVQVVLVPVVLGMAAKALLGERTQRIEQAMPLVSVLTIVAVVAAVVALSRARILDSGLLILGVVMLHNGLGLLLGYGAAKLAGLPYPSRKTLAIEVGMQNSGLGVALATQHFTPLAAVPSAIFSVWHNVSGSILAAYWSRRAGLPAKGVQAADGAPTITP
ncbi:bile acid:sodium symporter family protein [Amphibiibacter pelophylacis]|uniref:Bile acid:sodium symporter family protein n=1 Tax=Amphibiibacter pelophylacis TaxID=1799477 RepID=A0ACC6P159_9BURK